jgi:hypothetical protein
MMDAANALAQLATFKRTDMKYTCQYCKKHFVKESSLAVHSCEPRKRRQEQNEPGVRLGFHAYIKFYELTQGTAKLKTYEDFADSPYYKAFVKFGRYCVDTNVINPSRFTEWVLKQNKKLDYWCSDRVYEEYLMFYLRVETMEDALARALEQSIRWSETHNAPSQDYLRYGNHNTIIHAITSGKLSPWAIYNSESGQTFLSEVTSEQRAIIWPYIDPDVWMKKFREDPANRIEAQELLKQAGW